ncbi:MAG: uL30 family ribosomal protein [Holosporales bacterium]|jgi:large subunit ribosomal protein L30|nr:uL30 family ribosomal protein [Holosporales bacterium]
MTETTKKTPSKKSVKVVEKKTTAVANKKPSPKAKSIKKESKVTVAKTVKTVDKSSPTKEQKVKPVIKAENTKTSLKSAEVEKTKAGITDVVEKVSVSSTEENMEKAASSVAIKERKFQKMIRIIQTGSSTRRNKKQSLYLKSLGLGKIGKEKELVDSNSVRSLIKKVIHMIKIVE